jgi:hypothetical protein
MKTIHLSIIVILLIIVFAGISYVSADNVTSTAHGGLVRLHNELTSGTVSIGPLPLQSDIRQNMFYWCSTIGNDDSMIDPKILQFVQENSPDLLSKIPDVEQTNQKIRSLYWETLQRKLISDTQEFLYLHGMTSSIIFQYALSATSCPPITDVNGTFAIKDGNGGIGKYKFDLGYNAETYQYKFTQLEPIKFASPLKQSQTGISAKDVKCKENLVLVIKNNGMPICVKPTTVDKLFKRGILQIETTVQTSGSQCNTEFIPKPFELKAFPNGTSLTINYVPVFLMKPNSIGKICTNNWGTIPEMSYSGKVTAGIGKGDSTTQDVTVTASPDTITIDNTNKTIVYTITSSKSSSGFYRFSPMFSNCGGIPIAIGYNSTHSFNNDFPWLWDTVPCPMNMANTEITGLTGIDVAYITKEYR